MPPNAPVNSKVIAHKLEEHTRTVIDRFNDRTSDPPVSLMSDDCRVIFDEMFTATGPEIYGPILAERARRFPEWHSRIVDMTTSVNAAAGYASVWVTLSISGLPHETFDCGMKRESISVMTWHRKSEDRWLLVEMATIRGPGRAMTP